MKTKQYKILVAVTIFCLTFFSCSDDFINVPNKSALTDESFWQTEDHALQGLTATYAALQGYDGSMWTFFEEVYIGLAYRADDVDNNKGESYGRALASFTNTTEESTGYNLWRTGYTGIGRANQVIAKVPGIKDLSEEKKAAYTGEAKFLRALFYFYLVNSFERIPLVTTFEADPDKLTPVQESPDKIWALIEEDLKDIENVLPEPEEYDDNNKGRATKWAAKALLAKVYLFQEKWNLAETKFAEVVAGNDYSLLSNYEDNFNGKGENGSESLFEIQFSGDRANDNNERHPFNYEVTPYVLGGWELFYPSSWLVAEMRSDLTAGGQYSDRVYGSIYFDDPASVMYDRDAEAWVPYEDRKAALNNPVYFKKYSYAEDVNNYSGTNITLIRYADVLLMYAEALNENNKTDEAIAVVNQVRDRVHAAPLNSMSKDALRTQIRHHERPCELSMEFGIRWLDLYRWDKGNTAKESVKSILLNHNKPFVDNFIEGKHNINPIPLQEINVNKQLVQQSTW